MRLYRYRNRIYSLSVLSISSIREEHPNNELLLDAEARINLYKAQEVRKQEDLGKKKIGMLV